MDYYDQKRYERELDKLKALYPVTPSGHDIKHLRECLEALKGADYELIQPVDSDVGEIMSLFDLYVNEPENTWLKDRLDRDVYIYRLSQHFSKYELEVGAPFWWRFSPEYNPRDKHYACYNGEIALASVNQRAIIEQLKAQEIDWVGTESLILIHPLERDNQRLYRETEGALADYPIYGDESQLGYCACCETSYDVEWSDADSYFEFCSQSCEEDLTRDALKECEGCGVKITNPEPQERNSDNEGFYESVQYNVEEGCLHEESGELVCFPCYLERVKGDKE